MMQVINFLGKAFKKENREFVWIGALVVSCFLWFRSCEGNRNTNVELKRQVAITNQNNKALKNELRYERDKAGQIEAVKSVFISKLSDLEKLNKKLYDDIKKENGDVRGLITGMATVSSGKVVISNDVKKYSDGSTYGLTFEDMKIDSGMVWNIKGESRFKLDNGTIYPGQTEIFENNMKIKLKMGFKINDKGDYEVFAKSASPSVHIDDVNGVLLIPKKNDDILCPPAKKKKFGIGVQAGYGIGFMNKQAMLTPYVGVGISYNIIRF